MVGGREAREEEKWKEKKGEEVMSKDRMMWWRFVLAFLSLCHVSPWSLRCDVQQPDTTPAILHCIQATKADRNSASMALMSPERSHTIMLLSCDALMILLPES